jgi:hypothetical protein
LTSIEAGDETNFDRISPNLKNDRDRRRSRLGRQRSNAPAAGYDGVYLAADEIGRECRQLRVAVLGPAVFNFSVLAVNKPGLAKAAPERLGAGTSEGPLRGSSKPTHHGNRRLLCARRERPGRRRAADQPDEVASLHGHPTSTTMLMVSNFRYESKDPRCPLWVLAV